MKSEEILFNLFVYLLEYRGPFDSRSRPDLCVSPCCCTARDWTVPRPKKVPVTNSYLRVIFYVYCNSTILQFRRSEGQAMSSELWKTWMNAVRVVPLNYVCLCFVVVAVFLFLGIQNFCSLSCCKWWSQPRVFFFCPSECFSSRLSFSTHFLA